MLSLVLFCVIVFDLRFWVFFVIFVCDIVGWGFWCVIGVLVLMLGLRWRGGCFFF